MSKQGLHLYKRLALTTLTALIGLGGVAQADIHAAGPVYGGPASVGGAISCRVFNFGTAPVSITTRSIFDNTNANITPTFDTCGTPLAVGQYCAYAAPITGNLAYSCRMIDQSTSSSLSGAAEITGPGAVFISVLPLQK
jgi:hypothetical protein